MSFLRATRCRPASVHEEHAQAQSEATPELGDVDLWLAGKIEEASKLLNLAPGEVFEAGPA